VSVLSLEGVVKRYRHGNRERLALRDVSMRVGQNELVVVLGTRRSGRSTLMRIAAGLERPDEGRVSFQGIDLATSNRVVGRELCYCLTLFSSMEGDRVLDHVAAPLLARHVSRGSARRRATEALERADAGALSRATPDELDGAERVRVAIARALAPEPLLLVIDDPTAQAGTLQREPILRLLRSLPAHDGPSVLMSTDDGMSVSGADRVLMLDDGELRSQVDSPQADVVPLNARRAGA
jgi:ABC-type lipoprotein export system ATPase subunit